MEQKVIITKSANDVNHYLEKGWTVISVTAQHVNNGGIDSSIFIKESAGGFCFVIERNI
jgi:hypothetical protein